MKHRILILLSLVFFSCINITHAQKKMRLPERKHYPLEMYRDISDYLDEWAFEYSAGYSMTKFINPQYGQSKENSDLKQLYGYYINLRYNEIFPLIIDFGYSNSVFKVTKQDYFDFHAEENFTFSALKGGVNLSLLPGWQYFTPYFGAGYGYYFNQAGSIFIKPQERYFSKKYTNFFWKAGFTINFHEAFFLNAEYEQSFNIDKENSYSQLNFGIGTRLEYENVYRNHRDYLSNVYFDYSFGYSLTNFNNDEFALKNSNSKMKYNYGYYFNLRFTKLLPFLIDLGYNNSVFKLDNADYYNFKSNDLLKLTSLNAGINLTLPAPNFLMPYAGIGMGYNKLSNKEFFFEVQDNQFLEKNNKLLFWKAGLTLNLHHTFFLNAEYKKTFEQNDKFAHSQLNLGIGFRVNASGIFADNVREDIDDNGGTILSGGYNQTYFLNSTFKTNLDDGRIKNSFGASASLRLIYLYPIMFDIGYFSSQFEIEDLPGWTNEDQKVRHRGGEAAMLISLLSKTRYFIPYIGAGYQYSQLYVGPPLIKDSNEDYSNIVEMATNTSSPIYKFGLMMNFNNMSYAVEFKHSVFNEQYPFYQIAANIGIRF